MVASSTSRRYEYRKAEYEHEIPEQGVQRSSRSGCFTWGR